MKINEIFSSIQGEGAFAGYPVLFIRLSGCTRSCSFCDTRYHKDGKEILVKEIVKLINDSNKDIIVWTGGEPLLQFKEMKRVINQTDTKRHHLESNGDILSGKHIEHFEYVCVSPKDLETAHHINELPFWGNMHDIKIVTDLKLNKDLIPFATMLMPLTTSNETESKVIEREVWNYCTKNNIKFCLRQHIKVWGMKKGV